MPRCLLAILLTLPLALHAAEPLPSGPSTRTFPINKDLAIDIFLHKPSNYRDGPLFVVFHGVKRNAEEYRGFATKLAERHGALIAAPRFDRERFPTRLYQHGGLLRKDGQAAEEPERTFAAVPKLVDAVRQWAGRPDMPFFLIGHSGGGQFLVRLAAFQPTHAQRIVAANAGTHLFPNHELPYPYGFGKLPNELATDAVMQHYLAQPLTIYLGTRDNQPDENFDASEHANKQGGSRLARGHAAFQQARDLAQQKGWSFGWTLVEAEGVGHHGQAMFSHRQCDVALFGHPPRR